MSLKNSQYDALMRQYNQRQLQNRHQLDERIRTAYSRIPRLADIDREISSASMEKARLLLGESSGKDFDLDARIQELSAERARLLAEHGFPGDYLKMRYTCPLCHDTGYVNNQKCVCFKKAAVDLLYTQSNIRDILQTENFDHFSFDFYSDDIISPATGLSARQTARDAVRRARDFIKNFDTSFENLFLYGDTGVGKTFLSHCISKELIDTAHCVIYFSAFDLFEMFARNTFSDSGEAEDMNRYIFDCDLLIIDDLGTELTNSFVASQLFLCINERIMHRKSTIISTNLTLENFKETYSERVFSRISSSYTMIKLIGSDIRIQKKFLGGN